MELLSKDYQPDVISVTQHATKLIYNSNIDTTSVKNVVLIHNQVADYMTFVNGCNSNSFPIVYDFSSEKTELLQLLKEKFTSIQRVAFVFHGSESIRFLDKENLFTEQDLINPDIFSENLQFIINLANLFHIKNMDFLACNTLQHESWKSYYKILESSTGVLIGSSNDLTGNLKYGGDWMMENTQEEVQSIYFTDEILNYQYTLKSITLDSVNYYYSTTTATVTGFSNPPLNWNLEIPPTITDNNITYNVTSISSSAFQQCTSLRSINIPASVTFISSSVFYGCTSLTAVTIPVGVTSIGYGTFQQCTSLASITIPASVTSIGSQAFQQCTSLTSINIPFGVTSISSYAFYQCTSLTSINIPASVTNIGIQAFQQCTSLTSINIPASVTNIGNSAFFLCSALKSIEVNSNNNNYASIDGVLFNKQITTLIQYPIGKTQTTYDSPEGVTSIGNNAFYGCTSLTSITIPASVTNIGSQTFQQCTSLTSINIPASVTNIGDSAFQQCTSLTSINIPEGVTSIGNLAFVICSSLTSINIPEGVTSIGNQAFQQCTSLTSVTIPASVTIIGNAAFILCSALISIEVNSNNNNYASIGGVLFNKQITTLLQYSIGQTRTTYNIPEGVTSVDNSAFRQCTSLASITIPATMTSIGSSTFQECTSLADVNWTNPALLTSININSFKFCSVITTVIYNKTQNNASLPSILRNYTYGTSTPNIYFVPYSPQIPPVFGTFSVPNKIVGEAPFQITAPSSTSTGSFSYTSSNSSVATITGNIITIVGVGETTITATQAATENYLTGSINTLFTVLSNSSTTPVEISSGEVLEYFLNSTAEYANIISSSIIVTKDLFASNYKKITTNEYCSIKTV